MFHMKALAETQPFDAVNAAPAVHFLPLLDPSTLLRLWLGSRSEEARGALEVQLLLGGSDRGAGAASHLFCDGVG